MAIRSPRCECIAPAVRPVPSLGPHCAPGGARKPHGLQGNGLPHQRARWFAMTDLGVQRVWPEVPGFRQVPGGVMTPPGSCKSDRQLCPKEPAPKTVIARSAATWQSVSPQCAPLHRP